jgi:replicative DNA helicase
MSGEPYTRYQAQNLITILAHDNKHGRIVAQLIEPELFQGVLRDVAERCVGYWKKYKKAPGPHTADLFSDIIEKEGRTAELYKKVLRNMQYLNEGINTDYVLNALKATSRRQRMKDMVLKVAEIAQQETLDLDKAETIISEFARAREFQFDAGMRLTDVDAVLEYIESHYAEFTLGIDLLDRAHIVPARGEVLLFLAPVRKGKSWFLINTGKHALLQRKRVLHISLEMSAESTLQRYYQNLFAMSKRREKIEVMDIDVDNKGRFLKTLGTTLIKSNLTFEDKKLSAELKQNLAFWTKRGMADRLVVKRFPPRSINMDHVRAYLDVLEATTGFIPDMITLDYIGITKTDSKNPRTSLGYMLEDFRAVCIERNCAGVTAQQASKLGEKAYQVNITHVAEDWSLMATADNAFTYSQTLEEKQRGLARLWVGKARNEVDDWGLIMTQNYATGQFCLQSALLSRQYDDMVSALSAREKDDESEEEK